MQISFDEAQFLMQLIEKYISSFSENTPEESRGWKLNWHDSEDDLSPSQIEELWSRIQSEKLSQIN